MTSNMTRGKVVDMTIEISGDFYEEDEPLDDVLAAFDRGQPVLTLTSVNVEWEFTVTAADPASLNEHIDRVMDELTTLAANGTVHSPSVGLDTGTGLVEVRLSGLGDSYQAALDTAMGGIRTAIHAAGGATPDWPADGSDVEHVSYRPRRLQAV